MLMMHRQELESLFDAQLKKIIKCVKEALDLFEAEGYKSVVGTFTHAYWYARDRLLTKISRSMLFCPAVWEALPISSRS
jgi:hypothetical protein